MDQLPKLGFFLKLGAAIRWSFVGVLTVFCCFLSFLLAPFDWSGRKVHNFLHRFWCRIVLFLVGAKIHVYGLENIDRKKTYVIASNHEGNVEIPIFVWYLPIAFRFAAKRDLFRVPFFGWSLALAGHVAIDRGRGEANARVSLQRLSAKISQGMSILMFPEGRRTRTGHIEAFRSGTFRLALETNAEILPVGTFGSFRGQAANEWAFRPGRIIVKVGAPIAPRPAGRPYTLDYSDEDIEALKNLCHGRIVQLHVEAQALDAAFVEKPAGEVETFQSQDDEVLETAAR